MPTIIVYDSDTVTEQEGQFTISGGLASDLSYDTPGRLVANANVEVVDLGDGIAELKGHAAASKSRSRGGSRSGSGSRSRHDSRSGSRSNSRSVYNSRSASRASKSRSAWGDRSQSRSRASESRSAYKSRSVSRSRHDSRSESRHTSRYASRASMSRSAIRSQSHSASRFDSRSASRHGSRYASRASQSRSSLKSRSDSRSEHRSNSRSASRLRQSRSASARQSRSKSGYSQSKSRHFSRSNSKSASRFDSRSEHRSRSRSDSRSGASQSRSRHFSRSNSRSASRQTYASQSRSQSRSAGAGDTGCCQAEVEGIDMWESQAECEASRPDSVEDSCQSDTCCNSSQMCTYEFSECRETAGWWYAYYTPQDGSDCKLQSDECSPNVNPVCLSVTLSDLGTGCSTDHTVHEGTHLLAWDSDGWKKEIGDGEWIDVYWSENFPDDPYYELRIGRDGEHCHWQYDAAWCDGPIGEYAWQSSEVTGCSNHCSGGSTSVVIGTG